MRPNSVLSTIFLLPLSILQFSGPALAQLQKMEEKTQALLQSRESQRQLGIEYSQTPNKAAAAKAVFERLVKEREDTDSLMDLASCYFKTDFVETSKLCKRALELNNGREYTKSMVLLGLAGSRYRQNDLKSAVQLYRESLAELSTKDNAFVAELSLSGLGASFDRQKNYDQSVDSYEELYLLDRALYGAADLQCGWSLLQVSYALERVEQKVQAGICFKRAVWIFRKNNQERIVRDLELATSSDQMKNLTRCMFGKNGDKEPAEPDFARRQSKYAAKVKRNDSFQSPWKKQFKQVEAPGWVWLDPSKEVKAIVFCIHGLGLHHRSYEPLAKCIAPMGIMTIAMDVRGFGTYMEASGLEKLSMTDCVHDLQGIISMLRQDYPDTPLFVLGESMGGALALRLTAQEENVVDGLICSVPSGDRHQDTATAIKVGTSYLKNKHKPIEVGSSVVKRATTNQSLQQSWIDDPSSRLQLSAEELINFQRFMSENSKYARAINRVPVILFQGDEDHLVKEEGTIDVFHALTTPNKTLVILGKNEHLIFESGQFDKELLLILDGWINAHGLLK